MLNIVPKDKNGKPIKPGQWGYGEFKNGMGPPKKVFGKIMFVGPEESFVLPDERKGETIENSKIEIKID